MMKNKNMLLMLALSLMILSMVSVQAIENDVKELNTGIRFYHEYGTNLTIQQPCRVNGAVCDTNYTCFLSVISPSPELIINNQTMLGDGTAFKNYTLNTTFTRPNGIYEATIDCNNVTYAGSDTFFYQITPDGSKPMGIGQTILVVIGVAILLLIALFCIYLAFKVKDSTIRLSFLSLALLLMVFALGFVLNIIELSFGTFATIISTYSAAYILMTIILGAGGMGLVVYLIVVTLNYYNNMRGLTDKFSVS